MSYDVYCYRSSSDIPNSQEAEATIDAVNAAEESGRTNDSSPEIRERLVAALIAYNPRLERFVFDFGKIAEIDSITEDEARQRYQHVELNPPEADIAIQLTVYSDHVYITIPYWYVGEKADQLFSELSGYLKLIRRTVGFFAYDPQTGIAFDPERSDGTDQQRYERTVKDIPMIVSESLPNKNPWWKFW